MIECVKTKRENERISELVRERVKKRENEENKYKMNDLKKRRERKR